MNTTSPLYEYRDFLKDHYGEILHRVPLDPGFSCPNRTANGIGGCSFCPEDGARAVQISNAETIDQQIQQGIAFAKKRYNASAFMAYLQAFTSTFSNIQVLDKLVQSIIKGHSFRAIAFGARPDCLNDTTISYLQKLNDKIDVWVELGVQTSHDTTLKAVNRGHKWAESERALHTLNKADLFTAVHIIIGLPGEGLQEYKDTLQKLAELPFHAIKLHNLHIVQGTKLAEQFAASQFPVFSEYEYAEILLELLPLIPPDRAIIRFTTDTEKQKLIAPKWSMNKGQFREFLLKQIQKRQIYQGMALPNSENMAQIDEEEPSPVQTEDGSVTFWNKEFKEYYHTLGGAHSEAVHKYCQPANLEKRLRQGKVKILDICFGLGYNSLSSCDIAIRNQGMIDITALECDKAVVKAAAKNMQENNTVFSWSNCLQQIIDNDHWQEHNCSITLHWGDARHTINNLQEPFDLIWLDAFSTQRNSELWTVDFFKKLVPLLKEDGALLTYCAAIPVRSGMIKAGFYLGETEPFARERGGTIAGLHQNTVNRKIPERDYFLMETVRGIPYRDPAGTRTNKEILRSREKEIIERKAQEKV